MAFLCLKLLVIVKPTKQLKFWNICVSISKLRMSQAEIMQTNSYSKIPILLCFLLCFVYCYKLGALARWHVTHTNGMPKTTTITTTKRKKEKREAANFQTITKQSFIVYSLATIFIPFYGSYFVSTIIEYSPENWLNC